MGLWCHANDHLRRATVTVDAGGALHARHVQVKCVSGRYSSGIQVHKNGELLLHDSAVTCCTGSGIIVFGRGRIVQSTLSDNSFNGLEVQKGASCVLRSCHIHGNGYSNNDDDLGSGVTVYGAQSMAWLSHCCVHSNKGGGVLIHSEAQGVLRHSTVNMNHAGFEFADVDVDSDSEVGG